MTQVFARGRAAALWFGVLVLALAGAVRADPADQCYAAAVAASDASGVPRAVMVAITRTETGRRNGDSVQPWPWVVNDGAGHWFDTRDQATAYVRGLVAQGRSSFDIGCFQLNYRWHGDQFGSIDDMFDPGRNAAYAAAFLRRLHDETGDWSQAAGAYHSRTAVYATRYRAKFDQYYAAAQDESLSEWRGSGVAASTARPRRLTEYPLLRGHGGPTAIGSLVPLSSEG